MKERNRLGDWIVMFISWGAIGFFSWLFFNGGTKWLSLTLLIMVSIAWLTYSFYMMLSDLRKE